MLFRSLMTIGELTAGVRIQLEKASSRHPISEDRQFMENIQKFLFYQMPEAAKGEAEMGHEGPTPPHGAGPTLVAPGPVVDALAHLRRRPFAYFFVQTLIGREGARRRAGGGHHGPSPCLGAGPPLAAPRCGEEALAHLWCSPLAYFIPPKP